jgi:hypothetical protein
MRAGHERWGEVFRRAPFGILLVSALLALLGTGFVAGGLYLTLIGRGLGWWALSAALVLGPLVLYVALHLVRLSHWAWLALCALLCLLLASSILRLLATPPPAVSPLGEIVVEVATLLYLFRPRIRRAYGGAP